MNSISITSAQYTKGDEPDDLNNGIKATIDGQELFVPLGDLANRHYAEIMRQVEAGTLTIAEAD